MVFVRVILFYLVFFGPSIPHRLFKALLYLLLAGLFATGCNESFEPFKEDNQYVFSIYGYLDASADTQWVRVMPVREDFYLDPDTPAHATVTLEDMQNGKSVVMNDSLFAYAHGVYAYNFWTEMKLRPERTYRLTAQSPDGKSSSAEVELPKDFPAPYVRVLDDGQSIKVYVYIEGVERLVDVQTVYHIRNIRSGEEIVNGVTHLQDTLRTASGNFEFVIDPGEDEEFLDRFGLASGPPSQFRVIKKQIYIASAGPDWHHFPSLDEKVIALPEGISNIRNGVGYLAGIVSKTVPRKSCFDESELVFVPCPLEPSPW